jgi:hypothetical protein
MISLFITSLFLILLDHYRNEAQIKYIIPLPLIMLIWVNLHAGYILGLIIIAIYICGSLVEILKVHIQKINIQGVLPLKPFLILCGTFVASILATLANPNSYHIIIYPFQSLSSRATQQFIQEWLSPDFHQLIWQPLAWFILAIIGAGMFGKKSISATKILLTLFFGYAALRSMRYVPLFVIVTIPILAEQIASFVRIKPEVKTPSRLVTWTASILLVSTLLVVCLLFINVVQKQPKSEAETFPEAAVNWIATNHPEGNIFNSYGWGGYIIWRLYPQYQVYIDGRAFDVYGDKLLYNFMDVYHAQSGWEQTLDAHAVHLVLVEPDSGIAIALRQSSNWNLLYEDQISIVFGKK